MINKYIKKTSQKSTQYASLYFFSAVLGLMLLLRDSYNVEINKYIFLSIICIAVFILDLNKTVCLFCFIMPLYVGLPGNYITPIILLKFLFHHKKIQFKVNDFLITAAIALFILIQNMFMGYTSIYNMISIVEIFLVLSLLSFNKCFDKKQMFYMYVLGVAAVGIIMLAATLQNFQLNDLLTSTARLGTSAVSGGVITIMKVNIDPNYYGLFCIAAISVAYPVLSDLKFSRIKRMIMLTLIIVCACISLIGLSRSFVIIALLWIGLVFLFQSGIKKFFIGIIVLLSAAFAIYSFLPEVVNSILIRFNESDIITGNGRLTLISIYYAEWLESLWTILFGLGMFVCTVHCMQLQYLFGGGLVLATLMLLFSLSQIKRVGIKYNKRHFNSYIPMIVVFAMSATVPIATSMTFMFPAVIALFSFDYINEVTYEKN